MSIPQIDGRVTTSEVCAPFIEKVWALSTALVSQRCVLTSRAQFVRNFQKLYSAVPPDYLLEFLELVNSICGLPLHNIPRSGAASGGVRGDRDNVDGYTPESETDDVSESGTDGPSESETDNEPILTALPVDIDDQREIARRVRRICQRARASLETAILDVTVQGQQRRETLTAGQVQQAVSFFVSSIESVPQYIFGIVNGLSIYNTACNAEKLSAEDERPELIREFYQFYASLATTEYPEPIQRITRNVHLIAFAHQWRRIRETLERGGRAAAELERYFDLGGTATGKGRLSLAKSKLCKDMGLSPGRFGDYLRSAHIPTALVACFGYGAVMLVPRNQGWYVDTRSPACPSCKGRTDVHLYLVAATGSLTPVRRFRSLGISSPPTSCPPSAPYATCSTACLCTPSRSSNQ